MKVSVCMITYNHENYLKQAIQSVLIQKTQFDFELVIANDNSPDNSILIIEEFINQHPNGHKIKFLNNKENQGIMPNFINALKNCNGDYIALCEGDDYWIDENKLQKQVDFLEKNADFAICFHKVNVENNGTISEDTITSISNQTTTINDLARGNYIHTCSVVYRNHLFADFPNYFYTSPIGDYFLHMLNARYGKIHFINQTMAIYRVHNTSYWSSKQQNEREIIWIDFLNNIKENFNSDIQKLLQKQVFEIRYRKSSFWKKLLMKLKR
jgi:glycosyltransferase involved in cell wall biosynthesis